MSETAVPVLRLTDQGATLIARAVAQEKLYITRLAMGDGQLANVGSIPGLTAQIHERVSVPITKTARKGNMLTVSGEVALASNVSPFRWREVSLHGSIGAEAEVLMGYLYNGENGEMVSPADGVERSIYITLEIDPAANVEVILAPRDSIDWEQIANPPAVYPPESHTHTADDIDGGILPVIRGGTGKGTALTAGDVGASPSGHKHGAGDITSGIIPVARGGTGKGTALTAADVGASAPSIAYNGHFLDPVNQRGQTVYTSKGSTTFTIDGWRMFHGNSNGKLELTASGVKLSRLSGDPCVQLIQHLDDQNIPNGVTMTLSALVDGVLLQRTFTLQNGQNYSVSGTNCIIELRRQYGYTSIVLMATNNATKTFSAVKLEMGEVQTLAHQDASGSWILNDPPPNKALELAKCQRYFQRVKIAFISLRDTGKSQGYNALVSVPTTVSLRATPTVNVTGEFEPHWMSAISEFTPMAGTVENHNNAVTFMATIGGAETTGEAGHLTIPLMPNDDDVYIDLNAEL